MSPIPECIIFSSGEMRTSSTIIFKTEGVMQKRRQGVRGTGLPMIPLRDQVFFPNMVAPILVARDKSVGALDEAVEGEGLLFLVLQRDPQVEEPTKRDLHSVGVVARVVQAMRLPNGIAKVLLEGVARARMVRFYRSGPGYRALIQLVPFESHDSPEVRARLRRVTMYFEEYVRLNRQVPDEVLMGIQGEEDPAKVADFISAHLTVPPQVKQELLSAPSLEALLDKLLAILVQEQEILKLEEKIEDKVRSRMQEDQRQFYLQQRMRVLQEELGEAPEEEFSKWEEKIEAAGMPEQVEQKARSELARLRQMQPFSPEATVVRNYLDWLVSLPWSKRTEDRLDVELVQRILDEDHYGLEKPKERIVEHLAVVKLAGRIKGPVLCLVGPPGTGKTSLARSVARALGRNFVRVSLGGVRDEAEIRGHRRTYVGALPGRIIQSMRKAGSKNPVFLLDEVDKIGVDFRGDPAAALLEVLDPEQNHSFSDHYLEVDFDLSEVLFITTANTTHTIPPSLLDRMEVIELHGYLEHEKLHIAKGFLIPKQLKENGMDPSSLRITDGALVKLIRRYTDEAGVRQLQREIASVCRKVARKIVEGKEQAPVTVTARDLEGLLGLPKVQERKLPDRDLVGVATGLAWTQNGGDILHIEVTLFPGKGELILTGRLGEVMKESAQAAWSYVRSAAGRLGADEGAFRGKDVHIHIPEGAIPKDGPSAGVTMATALVSALTGRPVRRDVAMTGEVTLRGYVLPVGGLDEKILAAKRAGVSKVVLPKRNEPQVKEMSPELKKNIEFVFVEHMDEVLEAALLDKGKGT